jgi:hypothetical protein
VTGAGGGQWITFEPYVTHDVTELSARVKSGAQSGGAVEVRAGGPDGTLLGTAEVGTGDGWRDVTTAVENAPEGTGKLTLVFNGGQGAEFDVDSFKVTTG